MSGLVAQLKALKRDEKKVPQYFGRLTHALDILAFHRNETASEKARDIREMKFLCFDGDLKHMIRTVAAGGDPEYKGLFSFSLVDANPHIQAKNILLLYILLKTKRTKRAANAFIAVMYSLHLDDETAHLLDTALRHLLEEGLESLEGVNLSGVGLSRVREVWEAWLGAESHMAERMEQLHRAKAEVSNVVEINKNYLDSIPEVAREAVQRWIYSGDFGGKEDAVEDEPNITLTCLNPLLEAEQLGENEFEVESAIAKDILSSDHLVHAPHAIDSPYQDWDFLEVTEHFEDKDFEVAYTKFIKNLTTIVRDVYKEGNLNISFILSPIETVSRFVHEYYFDRIMTGKSADIHGTAKVLAICEPFLSIGNSFASIITHHRIWRVLLPRSDPSVAFSEFLRAEYLLGLEQAGNETPVEINASEPICISGMALCKNTIVDVSLKGDCRKVNMPDVGLRNLQWIRMRNRQAENEDKWSRIRNNTSVNEDETEESSGVFFASPVKVEEDDTQYFIFENEQKEASVEDEQKESSIKEEHKERLIEDEQKEESMEDERKEESIEDEQKEESIEDEQKEASIEEYIIEDTDVKAPSLPLAPPPTPERTDLDLQFKDDISPVNPRVPVKKRISKHVNQVIHRFSSSSPTSPEPPIQPKTRPSTDRSPKFFHVKLDDIPKKPKSPNEKVRDDTPMPSPDLIHISQNRVKALASKFGGMDEQNNQQTTRISTPTLGKFLSHPSTEEEFSFADYETPPEIMETYKNAPRKSSLSIPNGEKRRTSVSFDEHPNIIPEIVDENNNSDDEEKRNGAV